MSDKVKLGILGCGDVCEADGDDQQQPGDDTFEELLPAPVLDEQQQQRYHSGDRPAGEQRQVEHDAERDRPADHLGHVRGHRDDLGLHPIRQPGGSAQLCSDRFGQRVPGHQAELGRQVLHEAGHHVCDDDDPEQ